MIIALLLYFLALIALIILGVTIVRTGWFDAPFVPSGRKALRDIFKAVPIRPGEVFYDLGSGDGRVVREAARRGARAIGIERSWVLVLWSRFAWWAARRRYFDGQATFLWGNYFKPDLSAANTVFCYLLPEAMSKLQGKLERELKPGTRVVSRAFKLHDWPLMERFQFAPRTMPVYLYIKG